MKLPYIKVEYRDEDTGAPGKMSPSLIIGFGLHWAWVYLFMFNGQYILFPAMESMQVLLAAVSGVCHAATLLAYAVFLKQARALFATSELIHRNRVIAAVMVAAAALLCLTGCVAPVGLPAELCFVLAGIASGVGSAVFLMSFGVSFSVCDLPTIALCTALSVPVGAVAFAGTITVAGVYPFLGVAVFVVLPFAELLCLDKCSGTLVDKLEFAFMTMPVRTGSFAGRIGVPSVVFGVLLGLLRTCALTGAASNSPLAGETAAANLFSSAVFAASLLTCLALVMAMLMLRKSRNFAFRVLIPLIGILLALLCSSWGDDPFFRCLALFGSYFMLEACLWVMYSDIAQTYRVSAFTTFGFGHGLLSAASLAAFMALQPGGFLEEAVHNPVGIVVVGLVTLTLGVAVLPNAAEIRSTLIRGRLCPSFVDDIDDLTSGETVLTDADADESRDVVPVDESDRAVEPQSIPEDVDGTDVLDGDEARAQQLGRFKRKCAAVADTFLLSRKETEVLFLLAKGRNSAAIQEALYISAGTANTHMRHIYRKLDVHSQHELIELVESMDVA